jgi:hypothetical protein
MVLDSYAPLTAFVGTWVNPYRRGAADRLVKRGGGGASTAQGDPRQVTST